MEKLFKENTQLVTKNDIYYCDTNMIEDEYIEEFLSDGFVLKENGRYLVIPKGKLVTYLNNDYGCDTLKIGHNEYDFYEIDKDNFIEVI